MTLKLYVVVRHDLPHGVQAAQAAHAIAALALDSPVEFSKWGNKTLVLLTDTQSKPLEKIIESAEDGEFVHTKFFEPDPYSLQQTGVIYMGDVLTSVAFAPNWLVQNVLLADLPLACSPVESSEQRKDIFRR